MQLFCIGKCWSVEYTADRVGTTFLRTIRYFTTMWAIACPPLLSACLSYPPLSFPVISWHVLSYLVMTCLELFRIIYYCRSLASSLPFVLSGFLSVCLPLLIDLRSLTSFLPSVLWILYSLLYSSPGSFLPKYPFLFCLNLSLVSCFLSV